ncbi:tRNA-binding protein [Pseudooceanicola sp. CBS1P-1]|uniref:tRNA-binding protein n=1 Tax=Pseudooceanicola albus TaxID=2692189 RepID=A0A6L7G5Q6_9RHOB|nr:MULTISPECIES: tRNA-binding protein [Pseudooceanicola]MBT9386127.1 tRNA-binding protein [Pseudooceanicola endophyticus]MXN19455.1 tRNA-binding protein [Pseudooceanicola albus]
MTVSTPPLKEQADYAAFEALDLRIGQIREVLPFPRARNPSYKVAIDFGPAIGVKWSSAQITRYAPEELLGKSVVCVVNFGPRNIAGFLSEVLIMGAANAAGETVILSPESDVVQGGAIY